MNKIFFIIALSTIFAFQSAAKSWKNYAGLSLNAPFSQTSAKAEGADQEQKISQIGAGAELTYIGVHSTGFLLKADAALGAATSEDIEIQGSSRNVGIYENISLGAGFAFVNTDKVLFGSAITAGAEVSQYTHNYDETATGTSKETQVTQSVWLITSSVGADLFFAYNVTKHFGFFTSVAGRYIFFGDGQDEIRDEWKEGSAKKSEIVKTDLSLSGKYVFSPSIGVIWNF